MTSQRNKYTMWLFPYMYGNHFTRRILILATQLIIPRIACLKCNFLANLLVNVDLGEVVIVCHELINLGEVVLVCYKLLKFVLVIYLPIYSIKTTAPLIGDQAGTGVIREYHLGIDNGFTSFMQGVHVILNTSGAVLWPVPSH